MSHAHEGVLSTWTIYDHPADFPDNYVLREYRISAGDVRPHHFWLFLTLGEARRAVQEKAPGAYRLARSPEDHSTVVETWL